MRKEVLILGGIVVLVIVGGIIGSQYYSNSTAPAPAPTKPAATNQSEKPTGGLPPLATSEYLIREDSPSIGPKDAKVTIVEFVDPECESCALYHPVIKKVLNENKGNVRFVVRYMPLHPNSLSAATFLEAAGEQGKYWEAQDYLFQKQPEWGTKHGRAATDQPDVNVLFKKYAKDLGLDESKMNEAFSQNKYASKIARDKRDGEAIGVRQTPTIFVNGTKLNRLDETALKFLVAEGLKN